MPKKNAKAKVLDNLEEIPGRPGMYTVITITHDRKKEKALMAKIERDARKLRENTYLARLLAKSKGR